MLYHLQILRVSIFLWFNLYIPSKTGFKSCSSNRLGLFWPFFSWSFQKWMKGVYLFLKSWFLLKLWEKGAYLLVLIPWFEGCGPFCCFHSRIRLKTKEKNLNDIMQTFTKSLNTWKGHLIQKFGRYLVILKWY